MKRFFLKAALLCVLIIPTIAAIIFLLPLPERSYNLAILDKHRILENTASPKIVLAGGSNLAFSIDSAAIQNVFAIPVVNLGVHAGFGLGRILDDASPFLREGDVLIIAPEYSHFTGQWNGSISAYELIFDAQQHRLLRSPYYGQPTGFMGYVRLHLSALIARYPPPDPLAYSRYGFNEYGDYIQHLTMENQSFIPSENIGAVNPAYLAWFFRFVDDFTARGITVALSYPSYEEHSFRNSAAEIAELDAAFRAKENLLVISRPESYCFPADLFYDTVYHLNAEGRTRRTNQLIADLQASGLLEPPRKR
ncbi:MAG: hypothetical protein LBC72_04865 [Spirochaetaceae bacterium]|jgi:hypothetical protein|nr:hypothetical protein [Spirochaetaceae bacterium]